jgi:hypothetical protein
MSDGGQVPGPPGGYPVGGFATSQAVSRGPEGRLRAWARRRPEPRLWVTLAGAGCILAVGGLQLIAGDAQAPEDRGDGTNIPGILLSLLVVAAGFVLMHFFREQPASAAGVAAVVLGTPSLLFFLTFDENSFELPFSAEAVLGGSALLWLIAYVVGPGSGRPLLLGGALLFGWLFVIQVTEDPLANGFGTPAIFEDDPFVNEDASADDEFSDEFPDDEFSDELGNDELTVGGATFQSDGGADPTTIGIISVLFGGGFLVGARLLDRRRLYGVATPLVAVGHVALPTGILFLSDDLNAGGTGLAFVLAGGLVIWSGALGARRATTIIGAIELIIGVVVVLSDVMEEASPTSVGSALFVIGAALVLGSQLLHRQTRETPPSTPGPSEFPGQSRTPQPAGGPPYNPYAPGPGPYPGDPGGPGGPSSPGGPPSGPYPPTGGAPPQGPQPPPGTTAF